MIDLEAMTPAERAHLVATLTEERDAARAISAVLRRDIAGAEQLIAATGVTATGTVTDRVRALIFERDCDRADRDRALSARYEAVVRMKAAEVERDTLRAAIA